MNVWQNSCKKSRETVNSGRTEKMRYKDDEMIFPLLTSHLIRNKTQLHQFVLDFKVVLKLS